MATLIALTDPRELLSSILWRACDGKLPASSHGNKPQSKAEDCAGGFRHGSGKMQQFSTYHHSRANQGQEHPLPENQRQHLARLRTHCHTQPDFARSLRDRVRQHAINSNRSED